MRDARREAPAVAGWPLSWLAVDGPLGLAHDGRVFSEAHRACLGHADEAPPASLTPRLAERWDRLASRWDEVVGDRRAEAIEAAEIAEEDRRQYLLSVGAYG